MLFWNSGIADNTSQVTQYLMSIRAEMLVRQHQLKTGTELFNPVETVQPVLRFMDRRNYPKKI